MTCGCQRKDECKCRRKRRRAARRRKGVLPRGNNTLMPTSLSLSLKSHPPYDHTTMYRPVATPKRPPLTVVPGERYTYTPREPSLQRVAGSRVSVPPEPDLVDAQISDLRRMIFNFDRAIPTSDNISEDGESAGTPRSLGPPLRSLGSSPRTPLSIPTPSLTPFPESMEYRPTVVQFQSPQFQTPNPRRMAISPSMLPAPPRTPRPSTGPSPLLRRSTKPVVTSTATPGTSPPARPRRLRMSRLTLTPGQSGSIDDDFTNAMG